MRLDKLPAPLQVCPHCGLPAREHDLDELVRHLAIVRDERGDAQEERAARDLHENGP